MTARSATSISFLQRIKPLLSQGVSCGGDHSLRRKLLVGSGIALVCTAILAMSVIGRSFDDYRRARQNLRELENYRLILDAANLLSAERGPSNSVLGDAGATHDLLRDRLMAYRERSDAILDQLAAVGVPADMLASTRTQLSKGRQEVDRVAAIPRSMRHLDDVQSVIESMFGVVDIFESVIAWKAGVLTVQNPELAAPVMTGRMFGQLREYGGRIASQIMRRSWSVSRCRSRISSTATAPAAAFSSYGISRANGRS